MCLFTVLEIIGRRQNVCKSAEKFHAKSCKVVLTLYRRTTIRIASEYRVRYFGLTRTVFCRKELREKVEARIGLFLVLKSAHTDRLFVVISCDKISERFYIGANVSSHEPIFNLWQRL